MDHNLIGINIQMRTFEVEKPDVCIDFEEDATVLDTETQFTVDQEYCDLAYMMKRFLVALRGHGFDIPSGTYQVEL